MHEFETFVYLDMEKTGSSFITQLFNKFCAERQIRREHHAPMGADFDPGKFYFISVRHPLQAYLSLYSFGCQSQGKVHSRFRQNGLAEMYDRTSDGFNTWLSYVLRPRYARTLGEGYAAVGKGRIARIMGLQSYRYLKLALPNAASALAQCESRDDVRRVYAEKGLPEFFVRHESFDADLVDLIENKLDYAMTNVKKTVKFVRKARPTNASVRVDADKSAFSVRRKLMQLLREREWFVYELFDYDAAKAERRAAD